MEGQRAAEEEDVPLDLAPLCQAGDGLVDHRTEDAGSHVLTRRALVEEGLDVALGEHAAARGDGIGLGRAQRGLIELLHGDAEERGHLVDEGAGAAGTRAVHALLHAAGEEDDLGVLTTELDHGVRLRVAGLDGQERRMDLLHEGDVCRIGKAEAGRARHGRAELDVRELVADVRELPGDGLLYFRKMPLVRGMQDLPVLVTDNGLDGRRSHVDAQSVCFHVVPPIIKKPKNAAVPCLDDVILWGSYLVSAAALAFVTQKMTA